MSLGSWLMDEDEFAAARLAARLRVQNLSDEPTDAEEEAEEQVQRARAEAEAVIAEARRKFQDMMPLLRSYYDGDGWGYYIEHEAAILRAIRDPQGLLEQAKQAGLLSEMKAGIGLIKLQADQTRKVADNFRSMIESLSILPEYQTEMMEIGEWVLQADDRIKEAIDEAAKNVTSEEVATAAPGA